MLDVRGLASSGTLVEVNAEGSTTSMAARRASSAKITTVARRVMGRDQQGGSDQDKSEGQMRHLFS
jgi:hypothetical protein